MWRKLVMVFGVLILVSQIAASQEVYLNPEKVEMEKLESKNIEILGNASKFQGGQIEILYDAGCINITDFVNNTLIFPYGGWNSVTDGREFITFVSNHTLNDTHQIGTLEVTCISECSTTIVFSDNSYIFNDYADEITADFISGEVECKAPSQPPSDGGRTGGNGGGGGGGGLPLPVPTTEEPSEEATPTKTPFIPMPLPSTPTATPTQPEIPEKLPQPLEIVVLENVTEDKDVRELFNNSDFVKFGYETVIQKVIFFFEFGNLTGYRIIHKVNVIDTNTDSELWAILNVSKDIAENVNQMILPENVVVIEEEPIVGIAVDTERGENEKMEVGIVTDTGEEEFTKGIEISHTLIGTEEEAGGAGFPTTKIIVLAAGLLSAVLIFFALRRRV